MTAMLSRQPDLEVVAQAGYLAEANNLAAAVKYEVIVLDLGLPDGNGVDLIGTCASSTPAQRCWS
jgi:DNA-binding NarL/FixJ family response regulator